MIGRLVEAPEVPENARPSAVLMLLFPKNDLLHLLLMQRTEDGHTHSGQISFPGGRYETTDADLRATALREANEEVGIMPADVQVLGALTPLYIPVSNFQVHPFLGFMPQPPQYMLSPREVQRTIELPLSYFLDDAHKTIAHLRLTADQGLVRKVNAYQLPDETILWGATAMMLSELEVMLATASADGTT